jgi:hypothetical protein
MEPKVLFVHALMDLPASRAVFLRQYRAQVLTALAGRRAADMERVTLKLANVSANEAGVVTGVQTVRARMIAGTSLAMVCATRKLTLVSVLQNGLEKLAKKDHASEVGLARSYSNAMGEGCVATGHASVTQDSLVNHAR